VLVQHFIEGIPAVGVTEKFMSTNISKPEKREKAAGALSGMNLVDYGWGCEAPMNMTAIEPLGGVIRETTICPKPQGTETRRESKI